MVSGIDSGSEGVGGGRRAATETGSWHWQYDLNTNLPPPPPLLISASVTEPRSRTALSCWLGTVSRGTSELPAASAQENNEQREEELGGERRVIHKECFSRLDLSRVKFKFRSFLECELFRTPFFFFFFFLSYLIFLEMDEWNECGNSEDKMRKTRRWKTC